MPRQVVSYKNVATAAAQLKKQGTNPSLTDICEKLGLLSPPPELAQLLEKWYHNQPEFKRRNRLSSTKNIQVESNHLQNLSDAEKSLSILKAALESTADGIMMVNSDGQTVEWNQKLVDMWRIPAKLMETESEHLSCKYILDQLSNPEQLIDDLDFLYKHQDWQGQLPDLHFLDGRVFERYTQPQRIGDKIVGRIYSFHDVTDKRLSEKELHTWQRAIEASTHGVAIIDAQQPEHAIIYTNSAFERITGYKDSDISGKDLDALQGDKTGQVKEKRIHLAMREKREESVEMELRRKDGSYFWCELSITPVKEADGQIRHYVCILNDVTERHEMEEQLLRQAAHDSLTELPNRVLLGDRVEQTILQAKKKKNSFACLLLDLDQFKMINDTLGHSIGDKLLQAVSNRLLIMTNELDTVARFGGDEFVILLVDIDSKEQVENRAQEILTMLQKPFKIEHHNLKITASIGISFYPWDGEDYEVLMKNADLSMYRAKDCGRNTYRTFKPEMKRKILNYAQLDNALHTALQNNEFYIAYQPLIDLKKTSIIGMEALIRWDSPALGQVSPYDFVPIAEENGLIIDIGSWVLQQACTQTKRWHKQGFKDLTISVNISERQLHNSCLPEEIERILNKTGLAPEYLELELTESLLVEKVSHAVDMMYWLKDMGIKIAIDDFGTGYSSLSYLKQFPIDTLKIDKSFIHDMVEDSNDAAIVQAIIKLGHSLNLKVLAEGVEMERQKNAIVEYGCDFAQGYFYLAPSTEETVTKFLNQFPNRQ